MTPADFNRRAAELTRGGQGRRSGDVAADAVVAGACLLAGLVVFAIGMVVYG